VKDPKAEIRNPKEGRNPKSEARSVRYPALGAGSAFWDWDVECCGAELVFQDDGSKHDLPPRELMERTAQFAEAVVRFANKIPRGVDYPENNRLIDQFVGAGTSIGANHCEADDAVSGKDFRNKIGTCRKESKETMFFLRMIAASEDTLAEEARRLWREAKELNLIFGSIWRKGRQ
jgi:four helix bundle protein